jgi:Uma2 family endonuclease
MAVMTEQGLLPRDRPLTTADLVDTPDDGQRYELDDGVLVVSPAPMANHQRVLHRLQILLDHACPEEFELLPGTGVELSKINYRISDLMVVKTGTVPTADANVRRPPALVIEVASPSTARYDRGRKKAVYADFGIRSYWIVVPDRHQPSITEFRLEGASYSERPTVAGSQQFVTDFPFPVRIVPADLVGERWRR